MRSDSEFLRDYLESLASQRQLAAHTIDSYRRDLAELRQLAPTASRLTALTQFDIRKLAAQLHGRGLSARSIARKLSAWRGFFEW
ncbi:MAG: site-specific integrase, partial [Burkholderiaceae bacterium]